MPPSLQPLLGKLVDGRLDPADAEQLESLLRNRPAARAYYRRFMAVHLELADLLQADAAVTHLPPPRRRPVFPRAVLAVAAAVALAAGVGIWSLSKPGAGSPPAAAVMEMPTLAVVADARDVEWSLRVPAAAGVRLGSETFQLRKGELVLTMANGQTFAVRAPAEFSLLNEREMKIASGSASLGNRPGFGPYVLHVPEGAVVATGAEYAVMVNGSTDLRVFEGAVCASTVDASGHSRQEIPLRAGQRARLGPNPAVPGLPDSAFMRTPLPPATAASPASERYAGAVKADSPLCYWRFEETEADGVRDEAGKMPLRLMEQASLSGPPGQRFLALDDRQRKGFAIGETPISGAMSGGFSIECLIYPASENHGTILALESTSAARGPQTPPHFPDYCAIERMGRMGEHIGHIHPDYGLRTVLRFPAGYDGGTNLYSRQSHLLYRWHHAVLTCDTQSMKLYIDGRLSDHTDIDFDLENASFRPIIGRLQAQINGDSRQWVGGIDEVAFYAHVLDPAAILRHWEALK